MIFSKEVTRMKYENRIKRMESKGRTVSDCGVLKKVIRQLNKI